MPKQFTPFFFSFPSVYSSPHRVVSLLIFGKKAKKAKKASAADYDATSKTYTQYSLSYYIKAARLPGVGCR